MPYPAKTSPEAILQAALEILEEHGPTELSTRNLAEKLGIKAPSLYRHYPDRAALEAALVNQGARLAADQLQRARDGIGPLEAFQCVAEAYLEFARNHPHLYDLMVSPNIATLPGAGDQGKRLWNALLATVGAVTGVTDDTASTVAFWSFVHGFVSLERAGLFGASGPKGGFEVGLAALGAGFSRSPDIVAV